MMTLVRNSTFIVFGLMLAAQAGWSAPEFTGEKIVCETSQFEQLPNGSIKSTKIDNPKGDQISLRIVPVPLSKKNRAARLSLNRGHKNHKAKKVRGSKVQDDKSLNLQTKLAATPVLNYRQSIKGGAHLVTLRYVFTKVTNDNENILFNDEYAPNAFVDGNPYYPYYLTLRWTEAPNTRLAPHQAEGVLTSAQFERPLKIKFRCLARGI